ncbi:MAG TPA: stage III sporulation protein AG [Bacillales bacterium]|nr:stage III sporulation protein AG [Bacillales bacterium]
MNKWITQLFKKKDGPHKKGISLRYLVVILGVGIGLMLFGTFYSGSGSSGEKDKKTLASGQPQKHQDDTQSAFGKSESDPSSVIEYEEYYESQLKEMLEGIYGVSDVKVQVYVTTSKTKIVGKNKSVDRQSTTETDTKGGTREIEQHNESSDVVILNESDGENPLIIGTEQPKIAGVSVVAGGADNAQVKLWIIDAVHSLYGVPESRISVSPKKQRGNE